MSKKKAAIRPDLPKPAASRCFRCDGTGLICDTCGESEVACDCVPEDLEDGRSFSDCEDCKGTGK